MIEMMVVMFLIALIAGALAINLGGSFEEGKAFKTKAGMDKLEAILNLEIAKYPQSTEQIRNNWKEVARSSPIFKEESLLKDGWGEDYDVDFNKDMGSVYIYSKKYAEYQRTHNSSIK